MPPPVASDRRLYVYYRVGSAAAAAALDAVEAAQARLRRRFPGLQTELLRRPDPDAQGNWTWMETYRRQDGIDTLLQAAVEAELCSALAPWLPAGARHTEVFAPLGRDLPCA